MQEKLTEIVTAVTEHEHFRLIAALSIGTVAIGATCILTRQSKPKQATKEELDKKYAKFDKNAVLLHVLPRWPSTWPEIWEKEALTLNPSINYDDSALKKELDNGEKRKFFLNPSPFCSKLEALLSYHDFNYSTIESMNGSKQGKWPWIAYFDKKLDQWIEVDDSHLSINKLLSLPIKEYSYLRTRKSDINIDVYTNTDDNMTEVDFYSEYDNDERKKAIVHSFRIMIEQSLYWHITYERWIDNTREQVDYIYGKLIGVPRIMYNYLYYSSKNTILKKLNGHGLGSHKRETVYKFGKETLDALMMYLGEKKYFFGDKISVIDCVVFAFLMNMFEPTTRHYKGWKDIFQNKNENPMFIHEKKVFEYCTRVRLQLAKS